MQHLSDSSQQNLSMSKSSEKKKIQMLLIMPALGFTYTHTLSDEANWEHIHPELLRDVSVRSHIPAPIFW